MKKFLKIAAVLFALFFVAALVAPMAFRGKAEQLVKQQANALLKARLDFERLDISLLRHFPHASVAPKRPTATPSPRSTASRWSSTCYRSSATAGSKSPR